ncbi:UNVERIFIED_CONTAM: F-box/kelch-repeat protein SKIP30 [Sesamum angustifolium]|uniref:F-box/kelch-repeat protein SKIP30 n=1 Tax=Sesamum angustifolium TaxID=2727405 RepID=A0AAW2QV89_9LAMI
MFLQIVYSEDISRQSTDLKFFSKEAIEIQDSALRMSGLIEGLPDAVVLRCLARVPFHLHPKLQLVSHSWREAIRSTELFKARQEVKATEEFICVCAYDPDNLWQLYDPVHDLWITLPHLPSNIRHLAHLVCRLCCGKAICVGWWKSISKAEIYDPEKDVWLPIPDLHHTHNSACTGVVIEGKVHILHKGLSTVQVLENIKEKYSSKLIVSASEFRRKIDFAMIGLGDEIYVIGGVIGPDRLNWDIKSTSDVDVLTLGNERSVWRQVAPMTRCRGTVLGCTQLRI